MTASLFVEKARSLVVPYLAKSNLDLKEAAADVLAAEAMTLADV